MSKLNLDNNLDGNINFVEIAKDRCQSDKTFVSVFLILLSFGLVKAATNNVLMAAGSAMIPASILIPAEFKKTKGYYDADNGIVAPQLKRSELFAYERYLDRNGCDGKTRIREEINWAVENERFVTPDAQNYLRNKLKYTRLKPDLLSYHEEQSQKPRDITGDTIQEFSPDPNPTEFNPPKSVDSDSTFSESDYDFPSLDSVEFEDEEDSGFKPEDVFYLNLLICTGSMGSGKTTFASKVVEEGLKQKNLVIFCNPLTKAKEFWGVPVAGRVMGESINASYKDIEKCLKWFITLADNRTRKMRDDESYEPAKDVKVTLVCEEMTDWGENIDDSVLRAFWMVCIRQLRQLNLSVILITHSVTSDGLGGASTRGYMKAIKLQAGIIRLESKANRDPNISSSRVPTGFGTFKNTNLEDVNSNYERFAVGDFKPSNFDNRFDEITGLGKFPDWQKLVGIKE